MSDHIERLSAAMEKMEVVLEAIPLHQKQAYTEAKKRVPHLIRKESHPIKFLQCCNSHAWDAAKRMIKYWEDRKWLFGDRAFLPMTQTGEDDNSAMTKDDLVVLQAGFPVLIPNTGKGQVLFFDRRRGLKSSSDIERLRAVFYLLTVASDDEQTRTTQPLSAMALLVTPRDDDMDVEYLKCITSLCIETAPCKVSFYCLSCLPKLEEKQASTRKISQKGVRVVTAYREDTRVLREIFPGEIQKQLEELGFPQKAFPVCVGGTWAYEEFNIWCRERAVIERGLYREKKRPPVARAPPGASSSVNPTAVSSAASIALAPHQRTISSEHTPVAPVAEKADTDPATDKASRKRLLNVIHSRQKRERRKQEQSSLLGEKHTMLVERERLQREGLHLEGLLKKARYIVKEHLQEQRPPSPQLKHPSIAPAVEQLPDNQYLSIEPLTNQSTQLAPLLNNRSAGMQLPVGVTRNNVSEQIMLSQLATRNADNQDSVLLHFLKSQRRQQHPQGVAFPSFQEQQQIQCLAAQEQQRQLHASLLLQQQHHHQVPNLMSLASNAPGMNQFSSPTDVPRRPPLTSSLQQHYPGPTEAASTMANGGIPRTMTGTDHAKKEPFF